MLCVNRQVLLCTSVWLSAATWVLGADPADDQPLVLRRPEAAAAKETQPKPAGKTDPIASAFELPRGALPTAEQQASIADVQEEMTPLLQAALDRVANTTDKAERTAAINEVIRLRKQIRTRIQDILAGPQLAGPGQNGRLPDGDEFLPAAPRLGDGDAFLPADPVWREDWERERRALEEERRWLAAERQRRELEYQWRDEVERLRWIESMRKREAELKLREEAQAKAEAERKKRAAELKKKEARKSESGGGRVRQDPKRRGQATEPPVTDPALLNPQPVTTMPVKGNPGEAAKNAQEAKRRAAEEARKRKEHDAKQRAAEEARRAGDELRKRQAEAAKQAEMQRRMREEAAKAKAAADRQQQELAKRAQAEAERRRQEEFQKRNRRGT